MLAMVFSLGFVPVLYQLIATAISGQEWMVHHARELQQWQLIFFGMAAVTFPACFLCALYRLDINKVPPSMPRSVMLALAPYAVLACWLLIPVGAWTLIAMTDRHASFPEIVFFLAAAAALLFIGRYAAGAAQARIEQTAGI